MGGNPTYQAKLIKLRTEMNRWLTAIHDNPNLPEKELIQQLWKGEAAQPITSNPVITSANGKVSISCSTNGASIGFKIIGADGETPKSWTVYEEPFVITEGSRLLVQAHRIGFKASEVVEYRGSD